MPNINPKNSLNKPIILNIKKQLTIIKINGTVNWRVLPGILINRTTKPFIDDFCRFIKIKK